LAVTVSVKPIFFILTLAKILLPIAAIFILVLAEIVFPIDAIFILTLEETDLETLIVFILTFAEAFFSVSVILILSFEVIAEEYVFFTLTFAVTEEDAPDDFMRTLDVAVLSLDTLILTLAEISVSRVFLI
jgi:hypothetical protein